jgi:hypothetical protein
MDSAVSQASGYAAPRVDDELLALIIARQAQKIGALLSSNDPADFLIEPFLIAVVRLCAS